MTNLSYFLIFLYYFFYVEVLSNCWTKYSFVSGNGRDPKTDTNFCDVTPTAVTPRPEHEHHTFTVTGDKIYLPTDLCDSMLKTWPIT